MSRSNLPSVFCLYHCTEVANYFCTPNSIVSSLPRSYSATFLYLTLLALSLTLSPYTSRRTSPSRSPVSDDRSLSFHFFFPSVKKSPPKSLPLLFSHSTNSFSPWRLSLPQCHLDLKYFSLNLHCRLNHLTSLWQRWLAICTCPFFPLLY